MLHPLDEAVTEDELFSQQMVCILSREYASFLTALCYTSPPQSKGTLRGWSASTENLCVAEEAKKSGIEHLTLLAQFLLTEQVENS